MTVPVPKVPSGFLSPVDNNYDRRNSSPEGYSFDEERGIVE